MSFKTKTAAARRRLAGFTLVELSVVIVIIGILAAFAVPQYKAAVERSKAGEAFNYLGAVRAAQENYSNREGSYADDVSKLDVKMAAPKYFTVGSITADEEKWDLTLERKQGSSGFGAYKVTFNQDGFLPEGGTGNGTPSTIPTDINPMGS